MGNDVTTNPAVAEKLQEVIESLAAHAGSPSATKFSEGLADIVRVLTAENLRLNEVLRNETLVPPRRAVSIAAAENRTHGDDRPKPVIFALDHVGDVWQHEFGATYWERLPHIPTPEQAEAEQRARDEDALRRHRAAQDRAATAGFR